MQKLLQRTTLAALFCVVLMLTGCGQKGDLYLPEGQLNIISLG